MCDVGRLARIEGRGDRVVYTACRTVHAVEEVPDAPLTVLTVLVRPVQEYLVP